MPVRRITPADALVLRDVRLRALATDPRAFGSTYALEAPRSPSCWETWAREHASGADKGRPGYFPDQREIQSVGVTLSAHARSCSRARRRRGGRLSPALGVAHRDRPVVFQKSIAPDFRRCVCPRSHRAIVRRP
jgi:hypothetical protein